jgi:tetratricopeptide (TPR) repeat protein
MLSLVAGLPEDHVDLALEELVEAGLVEARGDARFGTHDLIRSFARTRLVSVDSAEEVAGAEGRLADWLLDNLTEIGRVYTPLDQQGDKATEATFAEPADAQEWLRAERRTWAWALAYLARTNQHRRVLAAVESTRYLTYRHVGWPEWETAWELALRSAVADADRRSEAKAHLALASIHGNGLVDGDRALFHSEQALSIGVETGDVAIQADALYAMADVHSDAPEGSGAALIEATRAREAYRAIGNGYKQIETTSMIAYILSFLERHEESVQEYGELISLLDQQGRDGHSPTDSSRIVALSNVGFPLCELGRLDEAMAVAREAMELADETGYHEFSAFSRRRMAIVLLKKDDRQGARVWFEDALRVCAEHQLPYPAQAVAKTVAELGRPLVDVEQGPLGERIADIRRQLDELLGPVELAVVQPVESPRV